MTELTQSVVLCWLNWLKVLWVSANIWVMEFCKCVLKRRSRVSQEVELF